MPCGGIYPVYIEGGVHPFLPGAQPGCFVCGGEWPKSDLDFHVYFCDEWDCWIHRKCVHQFLVSPEGLCVLRHGHTIQLLEEGDKVHHHLIDEVKASCYDG